MCKHSPSANVNYANKNHSTHCLTHTPRHTLTVDGLIILCGQSIQHCHVYTFCMITALVGGFKCNYVLNTCCQFRAMKPKATHLCYVCNPLRLPRPRSLRTESENGKHRQSCYPIIPTNIKRSAGKPAFPLAATGFARVFACSAGWPQTCLHACRQFAAGRVCHATRLVCVKPLCCADGLRLVYERTGRSCVCVRACVNSTRIRFASDLRESNWAQKYPSEPKSTAIKLHRPNTAHMCSKQ